MWLIIVSRCYFSLVYIVWLSFYKISEKSLFLADKIFIFIDVSPVQTIHAIGGKMARRQE
jgi:hypothetical protein